MALFNFGGKGPFRVRGAERDRDTDRARAARLCAVLDDLRVELERERDGLRDRYESVTDRAAFSQQSLEDQRLDPAISSTIDDLTEAMIRYNKRLAALEQQIGFVTELRERAELFPLEL